MSILKAPRNQLLDRMTKQVLTVVSEQLFCLRIDEDDFPSSIDDDHRVWRRLKQLTEGLEDFSSLHSKLRMPRHGAHISPLYWRDPLSADCLGRCRDIASSRSVHEAHCRW